MIYNTMPNFPLINNNFYQPYINQTIIYNVYNNQYFTNQRNNSCQFRQNQYLQKYQNSSFNQEKIINSKKVNTKNNVQSEKRLINKNNLLTKEKKEENIFEKINNIKMIPRRKNSIDTTICDSSFDSSSLLGEEDNDNDNEEINNIDKKALPDSKIINLKRQLSNISEANSELSKNTDDESNSSFFSISDEEKEKKDKNSKIFHKKEKYKVNPELENTEILNVNVKISKDKKAVFKLKRFDDIFETIKLFCEINSLDEKLIKPLIIKSLSTLNTIYQIMNSILDKEQINLLKHIKNI